MSFSFNTENRDNLGSKMFLDESGGVSIARYEQLKYPAIDKMTQDMIGLFWIPEEIDVSKDKRDFSSLSFAEQHIFTSNLKRQVLLDSIQGRAPNVSFLPCTSLPEIEAGIDKICSDEAIHSRSYTHIIRNVFNNPSEVFDGILDIEEIVDCAKSIRKYYDDLHTYNAKMTLQTSDYDVYEHKRKIYLALVAWNALEAVRFYVSFACSWAFAEAQQMVGNADIIKLICRDEERHRIFTQNILNNLEKDDPDFISIKRELRGQATQIFIDVAEQEKNWSKYLFQYGAMIGINENICNKYVEWLVTKRMGAIGLDSPYKGNVTTNPLPWTSSWINSSSVQDAPQEKEKTSYLSGAIRPDLEEIDFSEEFCFDRILTKF